MIRTVTASVAALAFLSSWPAMAQSDVERLLQRMRSGATQVPTGAATGPIVTDQAITEPPFPVTLKSFGQKKVFTLHPNRVAIIGYNVGGFRTAKTTGRASGGFNQNTLGAASTIEVHAWGIDGAVLSRIADAAYADLLAQFRAAGFEVVEPSAIMATEGVAGFKLGGAPYEFKVAADRGSMTALVAGPSHMGTRGLYAAGKIDFSSAPTPTYALQAMVVMPNLVFDFAELESSRSGGMTASASADMKFGISPHSRMRVSDTTSNRWVDADLHYEPGKGLTAIDLQTSVADSTRTNNNAQQALGQALGAPVQARSRTTTAVEVNQSQYEKLALSAARGWNAALVAQMRAGTGR